MKEKGFSLLELIIVIVVIGILVAIAIPIYGNVQDDARQEAVEAAAVSAVTPIQEEFALSGGNADTDSVFSSMSTGSHNTGEEGVYLSLAGESIPYNQDSVCIHAEWIGHDNVAIAGPGCEEIEHDPPDEEEDGQDEDEVFNGTMVSLWDLTMDRRDGMTVDLPVSSDFSGVVDWGDGTENSSTSHTYSDPMEYEISITGGFEEWGVSPNDYSLEGLVEVSEWGETGTTDLNHGFAYSDIETIEEIPEGVKNMESMFYQAKSFNQDISDWDVSNVINVGSMFRDDSNFNNDGESLSWGDDTANFNDMYRMFRGASAFNQDISSWDVSNATRMEETFYDASDFNQNISNWEVDNVTNFDNFISERSALSSDNSPFG